MTKQEQRKLGIGSQPLCFDLGGVGKGGARRTVNIHAHADVEADFTDLDAFCRDGSVDEFYFSHALEHVRVEGYRRFLGDLLRKLKPGGVVRVVQSDIAKTLELLAKGELNFRAARTVIFPPADRLRRNPYNQHFNMWGEAELAEEFRRVGFAPVRGFAAGSWALDTTDEFFPGLVEQYHGVRVPNLGVEAFKPGREAREARSEAGAQAAAVGSREHEGIPRIIHQTWKTEEIGEPFRKEWPESWKEMNPGWAYRFWTDRDLEDFIQREFPDFAGTYQGYDVPIKRVDAARYLILQRHGGVFVDLDFLCLQPLETILSGRRLVFGAQHAGGWETSGDHVCNAFMASAAGHPFWEGIAFDLAAHARESVLHAGGPDFLTRRAKHSRAFLDQRDWPVVLPSEVLYPVPWHDPRKVSLRALPARVLGKMFPQAVAATFWTGSWKGAGKAEPGSGPS